MDLGRRMRDVERRRERNKARKKLHSATVLKNSAAVRKLRRVHYSVGGDGYWNCGGMIFACDFCSALHFLGEKISSSSLKNPKFGNFCANGQVTPHFLLPSFCSECKSLYRKEAGTLRPPSPRRNLYYLILSRTCASAKIPGTTSSPK